MELGVALPIYGALASPASITRIAQEAEQLNYSALWAYERLLRPLAEVSVFGAPPQLVPERYRLAYEPLATLGHAAALTSRIKLGTSVLGALFHPPIVLARRFAALDRFSDGRVIAGLGQGWMPQEFAAAGVPMSRTGARMDEAVEALRACWGPDPVSYDGTFHCIAPSEVNPKPVQASIPVLMGSTSPGGIARAARIADGLIPMAFSLEALLGATTAFHDAARAAGRDAEALTVVAYAPAPLTLEPLETDRPFLGGSPRQVADDLLRLEGAGVDQVVLSNVEHNALDDEVKFLEQLRIAVTG